MAYTIDVVEIETGESHALPADAVTCDTPPCERTRGGPLLPLGFRARSDVFYVRNGRWPELAGRALRVCREDSSPPRGDPTRRDAPRRPSRP